jgi:hypothetical protein
MNAPLPASICTAVHDASTENHPTCYEDDSSISTTEWSSSEEYDDSFFHTNHNHNNNKKNDTSSSNTIPLLDSSLESFTFYIEFSSTVDESSSSSSVVGDDTFSFPRNPRLRQQQNPQPSSSSSSVQRVCHNATIEEEHSDSPPTPGDRHVEVLNMDEDSLVLHRRRLVPTMDPNHNKSWSDQYQVPERRTMIEGGGDLGVDTINVPLNDVDNADPNINSNDNKATRRACRKMRQLRRQERQWMNSE